MLGIKPGSSAEASQAPRAKKILLEGERNKNQVHAHAPHPLLPSDELRTVNTCLKSQHQGRVRQESHWKLKTGQQSENIFNFKKRKRKKGLDKVRESFC